MSDLIQVWICVDIYICLSVTLSVCGRELNGEIERRKKGKRPAWGFHYCASLNTEWPCHVMELLLCDGSGSLAGLQPPDSLSPCLHWLPAQQFTFNYLLSQTYFEEVQENSTKTLWRFYASVLLFGHFKCVAQSCLHDILLCVKVTIMRQFFKTSSFLNFPFFRLQYTVVSAVSGWMDIMWLLKRNVGVKRVCWFMRWYETWHFYRSATVRTPWSLGNKFSSVSQACDTPLYLSIIKLH